MFQGYPLERTSSSAGSSNWEGTFNLPVNEQIDYTYEFRKDGSRVAVRVVNATCLTLSMTTVFVLLEAGCVSGMLIACGCGFRFLLGASS